jgi:hypothetical protein
MGSSYWAALIAVFGTLGATALTLGAQASRERNNRWREDQQRFLNTQLTAATEVWAACDSIVRKINAEPHLKADESGSSPELQDDVSRFLLGFAALHLIGDWKVIEAANMVRASWEDSRLRMSDGKLNSDVVAKGLEELRKTVRVPLREGAAEPPRGSSRRTAGVYSSWLPWRRPLWSKDYRRERKGIKQRLGLVPLWRGPLWSRGYWRKRKKLKPYYLKALKTIKQEYSGEREREWLHRRSLQGETLPPA